LARRSWDCAYFPLGGLVIPAALPDFQKRGPMALFFFGGVLGNMAMIGIVILLHVAGVAPIVLLDETGSPLIVPQAGILVGTQVLFIILALIPQWGSMNGAPFASDGVQLVRVLSVRFPYAVLLAPSRRRATRLSMTSQASSRIAWSGGPMEQCRNATRLLRGLNSRASWQKAACRPRRRCLSSTALVTHRLIVGDLSVPAELHPPASETRRPLSVWD
jgi:hypothetical protein